MTPRAARIVPGTPLGERLQQAILREVRTVKGLEEEMHMSPGHIGRIIRGERWRDTVDVEVAKSLAAKLHVNFVDVACARYAQCTKELESKTSEVDKRPALRAGFLIFEKQTLDSLTFVTHR